MLEHSFRLDNNIIREIVTKEAVFIDFDGCFTYNGLDVHYEAMCEVLKKHAPNGLKQEPDNNKIPNIHFEKSYGEVYPEMFGIRKPETKEELQSVIKEHLDLYNEKSRSGRVKANYKIQEVIEIANKHEIPVSILSNGKISYIKDFLDCCNIMVKAYINNPLHQGLVLDNIYAADHVLRCDDHGNLKLSKTDLVKFYANANGIALQNCIMFDDSYEVIEEMEKHGIKAVHVKSSNSNTMNSKHSSLTLS